MQSYFIITPILFCGKSNLMIVEMIIDEKKYTTERYANRRLVGREKILRLPGVILNGKNKSGVLRIVVIKAKFITQDVEILDLLLFCRGWNTFCFLLHIC